MLYHQGTDGRHPRTPEWSHFLSLYDARPETCLMQWVCHTSTLLLSEATGCVLGNAREVVTLAKFGRRVIQW